MWNVKTKVIPAIIRQMESSQNHSENMSNIPGKHRIKDLQKPAILSTAHILWKVLMLKYKTFNVGNNITNIVTTEYLQHCIP